MTNPYIECGKIINTHGCQGGLKLESWCNDPETLAELKTIYLLVDGKYTPAKILKASVFKQFVLMTVSTVSDMDQAMALKGKIVYADRSDFHLEDGEYFIADLIGVQVIDANNGTVYGTLQEIVNRGASDIYVVKTSKGEVMIPVVPEFVDHVDPKNGIFVTPIDGMFEN